MVLQKKLDMRKALEALEAVKAVENINKNPFTA